LRVYLASQISGSWDKVRFPGRKGKNFRTNKYFKGQGILLITKMWCKSGVYYNTGTYPAYLLRTPLGYEPV
jgi:hypothetical protein